MLHTRVRFLRPRSRSQSCQRSKSCPSNNSKTTEANLTAKVKVTIRSEVKLFLKLCCSKTTEANLIKLHRKVKHYEKVCHLHDLGSYAQGQGDNQVRGQNRVSAIAHKLLKQI